MNYDAIVSIAYTGLAFINGLHTDDWIVEKLRGLSLNDLKGSFAGGWEMAKKLDIGQSVELLRVQLEKEFKRIPKPLLNIPFQIIFAGFYLKRINNKQFKRIPFITVLNKIQGHFMFEKIAPPKYWYYYQREGMVEIPNGYLTQDDNEYINELMGKLSNVPEVNADESENILLEALRKVSDRVLTVGKNCLSILIPLRFEEPIRIKYIPDSVFNNDQPYTNYSPWLICPNRFWRPSEMVGGKAWNLYWGGNHIKLTGLEIGDNERRPFSTKEQVRRKS